MKKYIAYCFCLLFSFISANVLGTYGQTYDIKEKSLSNDIQDKAKKIDMEKHANDVKETIKKQVKVFRAHNAIDNLPKSREPKYKKVSIIYTVQDDIILPDGRLVYQKGYKFNVLEHLAKQGIYSPEKYVVINGEREEEIEWFEKNFKGDSQTVLMITNGYPMELSSKMNNYPVYNLLPEVQKVFNFEETPSVAFQPKNSNFIFVKSFPVEDKLSVNKKPNTDVFDPEFKPEDNDLQETIISPENMKNATQSIHEMNIDLLKEKEEKEKQIEDSSFKKIPNISF